MTYVHRDAAIRGYTRGVLAARAAYNAENHCVCGNPIPNIGNRVRVRCEDCRQERAAQKERP